MGGAISLQLSVLTWLGSNSQLGSSFAFFGVVACGFFLAGSQDLPARLKN